MLTLEDAFNLAIQHHQAGRLAEAENLYRQVLAGKPDHAVAMHHLGLIAHQVGRNDAAMELISRAIQLNPNLPEAHNNLSCIYRAFGRHEEAVAACRRALALRPGYADACNNLGIALGQLRKHDEAIAAFGQAVTLNPSLAEAYSNMGNIMMDSGRLDEAIHEFRRSIAVNPNFADAHNNLGNALRDKAELDESIAECRRAIELAPNHPAAHNNLGNALSDKGELEEAETALRRAIALDSTSPFALGNLGSVLRDKGELDGAIEMSRRAIALKPDLAEAHHNLGLALLARGDFANGWREYEWRWKCAGFPSPPPNFTRPAWDGRPLEGRTILLHAEQGFGDAIQFVRYLPMVAERGGKIILECRQEQQRLFAQQNWPGVSMVAVRNELLPEFDCHRALLSLPGIFGTRMETIPHSVPYLHADHDEIEKWQQRVGQRSERAKIGLVWAGSPGHKNDRHRTITPEKLMPLLQVEGAEFFSLQKGKKADPAIRLIDWTDELCDFADTAALISNLDLVIAVDTAVAHLAGAMNKPVWVVMPFAADWRWFRGRTDSPWYPTMRLFRQEKLGDWDGVIARATEALAAWFKNRE